MQFAAHFSQEILELLRFIGARLSRRALEDLSRTVTTTPICVLSYHLSCLFIDIFIVFFLFLLITFSAVVSWADVRDLSAAHRVAGGAWCADHWIRWGGVARSSWCQRHACCCVSCHRARTLSLVASIYNWSRQRCATAAVLADPLMSRADDAGYQNHRRVDDTSLSYRHRRQFLRRFHRCCYVDDSWTMMSPCSAMTTMGDHCDHLTRTCDDNPMTIDE